MKHEYTQLNKYYGIEHMEAVTLFNHVKDEWDINLWLQVPKWRHMTNFR
jgi:hypothetical protein